MQLTNLWILFVFLARERVIGNAIGSQAPFNCSFDQGFCNWSHDISGDVRWRRISGPTPTGWTGPKFDHTSGSGSYIYLETSGVGQGTTARLMSPPLGDTKWHCLGFYYNMHSFYSELSNYASRASTLKVYVGNSRYPIWMKKIFHNNEQRWIPMRINIAGFDHQKVVLEGVRGMTGYGDIAVDDIRLTDGRCLDCDDTNQNCNFWKDDFCPLDIDRMRRDCQKTCGYCQ